MAEAVNRCATRTRHHGTSDLETGERDRRGHVDKRESSAHSSDLAPTLGRTCFRGTTERISDCFAPHVLAEVSDAETLQALPFLLPPAPAPSSANSSEVEAATCSRALWGQSLEPRVLLPRPVNDDEDVIPVDLAVAAKMERFLELKRQGMHFNQALMETHAFKNPHLYSGLIGMLGIDETASNLPFLDTARDGPGWRGRFPFSDVMLLEGDPIAATNKQRQDAQAAREAKLNAKGKRTIDFVGSSTAKESSKTPQAEKQAKHTHGADHRSKRSSTSSSRRHGSDRDRHTRTHTDSKTRPPSNRH